MYIQDDQMPVLETKSLFYTVTEHPTQEKRDTMQAVAPQQNANIEGGRTHGTTVDTLAGGLHIPTEKTTKNVGVEFQNYSYRNNARSRGVKCRQRDEPTT